MVNSVIRRFGRSFLLRVWIIAACSAGWFPADGAENDLLIVAEEHAAPDAGDPMGALARVLRDRGYEPRRITQDGLQPSELSGYRAVFMYVHETLEAGVEAALIQYAGEGGRLIVLHHGIASAKRRNPAWLDFLGIEIRAREDATYPWAVAPRTTHTMVNLAPGHFLTSHKVKYERLVDYESPDRTDLRGAYPAFDLKDTEIFRNQRVIDGKYSGSRKKTYLFGYHDPGENGTRMEDTSGWLMPAGAGWVFYLQAGHAAHDFEDPNFAQVLVNCLLWRKGMRPESVDPLVKEAMNAPEAPLPLAIVDAASPASALEREPAGWLDISPGPNLEGWTDYPWPPGTPRERMRRRLWSMDQGSGTLRAARGDQTTILVTDEMYRDFVLHVEYRYPRGELGIANSGVQVRMIPGERVMHQFELYESIGFLMGGVVEAGVLTELKAVRPGYGEWELAPIHTPRGWNQFVTSRDAGPDPKAPAVLGSPRPVIRRPRGEWNIVEVTAVGGRIVVWMNGGVASYTDQVRVARGAVALEAEHFPIEFRNIRIKLLP